MKNIDQGTIFYGLRSKKYPEVPSYAVIISARCDIANKKISKLYYLSAIDAHDWFCTTHGFQCAFSQHISSCRNKLDSFIRKHEINVELLESFDKESAISVLTDKLSGKDQKKALEGYEELYNLSKANDDFESRKSFIRCFDEKKKASIVTAFLTDISSGKKLHYHFIPKTAYTELSDKTSGLIVDLQEIGIMSLEEAKMIYTPGIDYQTLVGEENGQGKVSLLGEDIIDKYWLQSEDDFVYEEGQLKSPWRELLLQRFALDFIRIGVDGATNSDYECLASNIGKEK